MNPRAVDPTELAEYAETDEDVARRIVIKYQHALTNGAETPGKPLAW